MPLFRMLRHEPWAATSHVRGNGLHRIKRRNKTIPCFNCKRRMEINHFAHLQNVQCRQATVLPSMPFHVGIYGICGVYTIDRLHHPPDRSIDPQHTTRSNTQATFHIPHPNIPDMKVSRKFEHSSVGGFPKGLRQLRRTITVMWCTVTPKSNDKEKNQKTKRRTVNERCCK